MKRAAIFDLDGTLVDSMWVWDFLMIDFLKRYGLDAPPHVRKEVTHMSLVQSSIYVQQYFRLPMTAEEILEEWRQMVYTAYAEKIQLKKGAKAYLERLKEEGVKIGLATSCDSTLCEACLIKNRIKPYFDAITYADEVGIGKKSPDIYIECLKRLGCAPQDAVLFEDILTALRTGKSIGMKTVAVEDARAAAERDLLMKEADWYIRDFEELIKANETIF